MNLPRVVADHVKSSTRPPAPNAPLAPGDVLTPDGKAYRAGVELAATGNAWAAKVAPLVHVPGWEFAVVEDFARYNTSSTDLKVMLFGTVQVLKPGQPEDGERMPAVAGRGHWSWSFADDTK